jgi:hypothetical protein
MRDVEIEDLVDTELECNPYEFYNYKDLEEYIRGQVSTELENHNLSENEKEKFMERALDYLEDKIKEEAELKIEEYFEDEEDIRAVVFALGVRQGTSYDLATVVKLTKGNEDLDPKKALEKAGITPHAYGTLSQTNNWANYWFEKVNIEDLDREDFTDSLDLDFATVITTQKPQEILKI